MVVVVVELDQDRIGRIGVNFLSLDVHNVTTRANILERKCCSATVQTGSRGYYGIGFQYEEQLNKWKEATRTRNEEKTIGLISFNV